MEDIFGYFWQWLMALYEMLTMISELLSICFLLDYCSITVQCRPKCISQTLFLAMVDGIV